MRTTLALVAIAGVFVLAGSASAVIFQDGDFTNVFFPSGSQPEPWTAGGGPDIGDLHRWFCCGNNGQMEVSATGGNPDAYLMYNYWGDIRCQIAFTAAELGDGVTVSFDAKGHDGPMFLWGLNEGETVLWFASGHTWPDPATTATKLIEQAMTAEADWTTYSYDVDLTAFDPFEYYLFEWDIVGTEGGGLDNVVFEELATGVPGDTDGDGDVDLDDLFAVRNNFGTTTGATLADGDTDGDADVDLDDLFTVRNNFGTGLIVPEPMTLSLLGLGAAAFIRRRR